MMAQRDSSLCEQVTGQVLCFWVCAIGRQNSYFFDQNVTKTDFDRNRLGVFFFSLSMNNAIISEYFCVKVLVAAVRLFVSNHI